MGSSSAADGDAPDGWRSDVAREGAVHAALGFLLFLPAGIMIALHAGGGRATFPNPETAFVIGLVGSTIMAFLPALAVTGATRRARACAGRWQAAKRSLAASTAGSVAFGLAGSLAWGVAAAAILLEDGRALVVAPAFFSVVFAPFVGGAGAVVAYGRWEG